MGYCYYVSPLILTVVAVIFWIYPPKRINDVYGYRTSRSRKSQPAWDFAQTYSARLMALSGVVTLILAVGAHWLRNQLGLNSEYMMLYDLGIMVVLPGIAAIPPIVMTERELCRRF